jgi:hypothetical protein
MFTHHPTLTTPGLIGEPGRANSCRWRTSRKATFAADASTFRRLLGASDLAPLEVDFLGHLPRVVDLDAEVSGRALLRPVSDVLAALVHTDAPL